MKSKQINYFLFFFFSIVLFIGCTKNKPKEGDYECVFTYTTPNGGFLTQFYKIIDSDKNTIEIVLSDASWTVIGETITLNKIDKLIIGCLPTIYENSMIKIEGNLKLEKGKYKIKGKFNQSWETSQGAYSAEGTFELKQ